MNLVLDIGNSAVKIALFEKNNMVLVKRCLKEELTNILSEITFNKGIVSNVDENQELEQGLKKYTEILFLDDQLKLPIKNSYMSPKTLGYDRLSNAVGAFCLAPDQNNLIIDMGTCIKFDVINDQNEYLGGSISPGLKMRYKALNTFTAKLPLLEGVNKVDLIGTDTKGSICSGVINGVVSEIDSMVNKYREKYSQLNIYLTGGDAQVYISIAEPQKSSIFAHDYITLLGLNAILEENAI